MEMREMKKIFMVKRLDDVNRGTVFELFEDGVFIRGKSGNKQKTQKWLQVALESGRAKPLVNQDFYKGLSCQ